MAEMTEKTGEKKLSVAATKTLTLKGRGVEQGVVRQSFSHGRSKAVVIEKVKSRVAAGLPLSEEERIQRARVQIQRLVTARLRRANERRATRRDSDIISASKEAVQRVEEAQRT